MDMEIVEELIKILRDDPPCEQCNQQCQDIGHINVIPGAWNSHICRSCVISIAEIQPELSIIESNDSTIRVKDEEEKTFVWTRND